jgi:hypothetical protein
VREEAVMAMEQPKRQVEEISGVSNLNYDIMAMLCNKLQGIAALEEYKLDARDAGNQDAEALFDRLQQRAAEDANELKAFLSQSLR